MEEIVDSYVGGAKYQTLITQYSYSRKSPSDTAKRNVKGYIKLPLPLQMPEDQYSAGVRDFNLGEIGTSIDTIQNGISGSSIADIVGTIGTGAVVAGGVAGALYSILGKLTKKTKNSTDGSGRDLGGAGAEAAAAITAGAAAALPYVGAYTGTIRNPHTALLFEGMNLRSFNFTFRLSPHNLKESEDIDKTIRKLKIAMHPYYSETFDHFALSYPDLFEVEFTGGMLNKSGYPKVGPSFITGLSVNVAPQGNAFHEGGYPSVYDIAIQFKEIDMKTRESFGTAGVTSSSRGPGER